MNPSGTVTPVALLIAAAAFSGAQSTAPSSYAIFSPAVITQISASNPHARDAIASAEKFVDTPPHPLVRVHTKGTLPGDPIREQSKAAEKDWEGMLYLGLAYRLTGDPKYLSAADRYLAAWSNIYTVTFNPIDETHLSTMMMGYDLTRGHLSTSTEQHVTTLWRTMAEGYIQAMEGPHKDDRNLYSHRTKLAVMAAYETGDPALEARAKAVFRKHVKRNIRKDGSVEDFYKRDALYYVTYDLDPLLMAAIAARMHGEDWFHTGDHRHTIAHAIAWLIPYALGEKTHMEFVHSTEPADAKRRKAGEGGFSGQWNPAKAVDTLALAAILDPRFATPLLQCVSHTGRAPSNWLELFPLDIPQATH
ncbi:MAG TPA: alginate lyase family protein [Acidobacteriaceae bacterium]